MTQLKSDRLLVGVSCFTEELRIGFGADTTGTLSAGLDAEAPDRTAPALRTDFLLNATFLGVLIWTSLLRTILTPIFLITSEALRSALHTNPQSWQMNSDCEGRLSL